MTKSQFHLILGTLWLIYSQVTDNIILFFLGTCMAIGIFITGIVLKD